MSYDASSWTSERARLGQLVWRRAPESEIIEARRNYRALRLAEHIRRQLADDPPLNEEQRQHLADLLVGGAL
jgi:hypothetical protein